ncbi:MAG: flagellar basal body L-ring protein FlgH [Desulfobacteraceae bacterium]|nr:MAG: flagellar basal body L-ring protein FlgH [Desulfobacteraceae bacterium]
MERTTQQTPPQAVIALPQPEEGSIWTDNGASMLYSDPVARNIGDTLTVDIIENTSSSLDANTKASRTSSIDAGVSQLLGYMRVLEEANRRLNRDRDGELNDTQFKASMQNSFDGKGTSDRSGQVTASIGAIVTEVLPNGNLSIFGKRGMRVNNETQIITVSGTVRPQDIGRDNRVKSTFIANARIEYVGQGVLADKQRPGWGTRLLDHIWPF